LTTTSKPTEAYSSMFAEDTAKLITEGRVTGLPHIVRLRFVYLRDSFYVLGGASNSDWVKNVLQTRRSKFRLEEYVWNVSASLLTSYETAEVITAFSKKYGARVVRDWYQDAPICVQLVPKGIPIKRASIRGEAETSTSFAVWLSKRSDYYGGVASAFDSAAEEYDFTISNNYINTWIREKSINELLQLVGRDDTLVEIGCGTGAEAIIISKRVGRIVATDISPKMIDLLKVKIRAKGLSGKIFPALVRAAEISKVTKLTEGKRVTAAYSFNGALNCEPNLSRFVDELDSTLQEGGHFVCTIRNSLCLAEVLSHAAVFQFDRMTPRKKQPVMVSVGGIDIPSFYYSPGTFAKYFGEKFKLRKLIGLPAILPPAYLSDYYVKFKRISPILERTESLVSRRFPFNRLGDQTLFVFQKV